MPRMLDLFCGRFGWGKAFAAAGWEVVGIDLVAPTEIPTGCTFVQGDILKLIYGPNLNTWLLDAEWLGRFDFICASSPCEQFSVHGMKCFHPKPKYPELGIKLFEHTRAECERSGTPYVMENVRPAREFIGTPVDHCGPFYLWGNAVPARMPREKVSKGISLRIPGIEKMNPIERRAARKAVAIPFQCKSSNSQERRDITAAAATIPAVLAQAVLRAAEDPTRRRRKEVQEVMQFPKEPHA